MPLNEPAQRPLSPLPPCAIVLAAGLGRRMGGWPKPALRVGGQSLLERLAQAFRQAGVAEISVVLGPYADVLRPLAVAAGAQPLLHAAHGPTLVDSQRLALEAHAARHPGRDLMLVLADLPLLTAAPLCALLQAWSARPAGLQALVPTVGGVHGHPVLLSWQAVEEIRRQSGDEGVRHWMAGHAAQVLRLPCSDPGHVFDLDTPEDLARLRALLHPEVVEGGPQSAL